jgi:ubiquinone/menaquinone biosynthesis C-methylase UbiE
MQAVLEPWIVKRYAADDPEWQDYLSRRLRELRWRLLKRRVFGWLPRVKRTTATVLESYTQKWAERYFPSPTQANQKRSLMYVRDGAEGLLLKVGGTPLMHGVLIGKILERLRPRTVLEVGSGYGANLFALAAAFPDVKFTGVELTPSGVAKAQSIVAEPSLPEAARRYSALPVRDETAYRRIEFVQGNAAKLPFADNQFDLVFLRQALEQMESVREAAMREIARVARHHVLLIEMLADFNQDPHRRTYIRATDLITLGTADLPRFGLQPVAVFDRMPSKVTSSVQMVLSEKR